MPLHKYGGNSIRIQSGECLHDHLPCFQLIGRFHLVLCQITGTRNLAVEIVSMRGPECRNGPARLSPAGGPLRVGMNDPADIRKAPVQFKMGRRVAAGFKFSFNDPSIKFEHYHVFRLHIVVGEPRRLNNHQPLLPVDPAYVSPGKNHQSVLHQVKVGPADIRFQFFEHSQIYFFIASIHVTGGSRYRST